MGKDREVTVHRKIWPDGTFVLEGRRFVPEEALQPGYLIYVRYRPSCLESYDQGFAIEYLSASDIFASPVPVRNPHRTAQMRRIRRLADTLKTSRNSFSPNRRLHKTSQGWRSAHILRIGDEIPATVLLASHFFSAQGRRG
jgi:hypothetical protein